MGCHSKAWAVLRGPAEVLLGVYGVRVAGDDLQVEV